MEIHTLLKVHWFELLQSTAIVSAFIYTSLSFSLESRFRRGEITLKVNTAHREIWSALLEDPRLARILEPASDTDTHSITNHEEHFVLLVLLHLSAVHEAIELDLYPSWDGLDDDIRRFFSLPIPHTLLKRYLPLQRPGFRAYLKQILISQSNSRKTGGETD